MNIYNTQDTALFSWIHELPPLTFDTFRLTNLSFQKKLGLLFFISLHLYLKKKSEKKNIHFTFDKNLVFKFYLILYTDQYNLSTFRKKNVLKEIHVKQKSKAKQKKNKKNRANAQRVTNTPSRRRFLIIKYFKSMTMIKGKINGP